MDTCPLHAVSPHSRVRNTKTSCNSSRTRTWAAVYHMNNAFFIDAFINTTLGCSTNAGKCTGISQCLVNSSKHSSVWYSTVREPLLIFSYGKKWVTVTKTVHIYHICILFNWKCKWLRERNRHTEMRIRTGLSHTPLRSYRRTVLNTKSRHTVLCSCVMQRQANTNPPHLPRILTKCRDNGNCTVCSWLKLATKLAECMTPPAVRRGSQEDVYGN